MRINDHLRGVQDFFLPRGEPILSDGEVMLHLMLGHGVFLTAWLQAPMGWRFMPSVKPGRGWLLVL
jgi:hypothetical protein